MRAWRRAAMGIVLAGTVGAGAAAGSERTTLASLGGRPTELSFGPGGALFGTTSQQNDRSTIFRLAPPATSGQPWTYTSVVTLPCQPAGPYCPIQSFAGKLQFDGSGVAYGTTSDGGDNAGGSVFRLSPPAAGKTAWAFSTLYSFQFPSNQYVDSSPVDGLVRVNDALFVPLATSGAPNAPFGAVARLDPPAAGHTAWAVSILHRFTAAEGGPPSGNLLARVIDGNLTLFGVTGGDYDGLAADVRYGTVFRLAAPRTPNAPWTLTTLYAFRGGADGQQPRFALVADSGLNLYGVLQQGGGAGGCGAAFRLSPPAAGHATWTKATLATFAGAPDGCTPNGALAEDGRGRLYGVTAGGGAGDVGTVFRLTPRDRGGHALPWNKTALYGFPANRDNEGGLPVGDLLFGSQYPLSLYGNTASGGASEQGMVYRLDVTP